MKAYRKTRDARRDLIRLWRSCDLSRPPYVLPDDLRILKEYERKYDRAQSPEELLRDKNFEWTKDDRIHLGMLPNPYHGNLKQAKVYLLMLNPGFHLGDFRAHRSRKASKDRKREIWQRNGRSKYPFHSLQPQYFYGYWADRFRWLIEEMKADGWNYPEALRKLSKAVSCVQLVPYRTTNFQFPRKVLDELESTKRVKRFVHHWLVPRAKSGKRLIVVTRGEKRWGLHDRHLKKCPNILFCPSRSGYFSEEAKARIRSVLGL